MVVYKILDGFADCFDSEFQRQGRLDLTGKSNAFRTLVSVAAFCLVMFQTRDLVLSCAASVFGQAAGILLFWFLLAVTGNGFHLDGSVGRGLLCCLLPVCLLLGGILMFNRPENYVYTEHDLELSRRFDRLNQYFDLLMGGNGSTASISDPDQPAETSGPRSRFQSAWDGDNNSMHTAAMSP
jgi:hypothetical protein